VGRWGERERTKGEDRGTGGGGECFDILEVNFAVA